MAKLRRFVISESGAWYVEDSDETVDCCTHTDCLANVLLPVVPVKPSTAVASSVAIISKDFIVIICVLPFN